VNYEWREAKEWKGYWFIYSREVSEIWEECVLSVYETENWRKDTDRKIDIYAAKDRGYEWRQSKSSEFKLVCVCVGYLVCL